MSLSSSDEKEMLLKVRDIHAVFIGIEGQPGRFATLSNTVEGHGRQLGRLQKFQWALTGMGVVIGYLFYHLAGVLGAVDALKKISFVHTVFLSRT
jgi:hypothetical protein